MTDNQELNQVSNDNSANIGDLLKSTRESKGLTIEAIASRLRISHKQVTAMETNDFDVLGEPMIARGFLRNYAKLLEIDAEPLIEQFKSIKPNIAPRSLSLSSANIPINANQKSDWQKYLGVSVFIGLTVLAWLFYSDYQSKQLHRLNTDTVNKVKDVLAPVVEHVVNPVVNTVSQPSTTIEHSEAVVANPSPAQTPVVEPISVPNEVKPEPVLATPPANLAVVSKVRFKASESSWVHVMDANNKVILDAIVPASGEAYAEGKPPFNVVIGNAPVSYLEFNQQTVNLVPFTKGKVARLKLE